MSAFSALETRVSEIPEVLENYEVVHASFSCGWMNTFFTNCSDFIIARLFFFRISLTLSLLQWFNRWHLVIVIPIIAISFFHHGEDVLSLKRNMNLCDGFIIVGFLQLLMFTENKFFWVGFCFYPLINDDICPLNHFIQSCLCTT